MSGVEVNYVGVIGTLVVSIFSILAIFLVCTRVNFSGRVAVLLVIYHTALCIVYYLYSLNSIADAYAFYIRGILEQYKWTLGTNFVIGFTSLLVNGLGITYFNAFLVFNAIGIFGICLMSSYIFAVWPYRSGRVAFIPYAIAFIPSLNFWTASIGKDAPAFLAVCMVCYAVLNLSRRKFVAMAGIAIMMLIRPHIAAIMFLSLGGALVISRHGISPAQRIFLLFAGFASAVFIIPVSLAYVGMEGDVSIDAVLDNVERRQALNLEGGSSVNIQSMTLPVKIVTYMFRPLFFDANSIFSLVASFENAFLLISVVLFSPMCLVALWRSPWIAVRFSAIFTAAMIVILASTTANLGIAFRQKTMLLPSLFLWIALAANWKAALLNRGLQVRETSVRLKQFDPSFLG